MASATIYDLVTGEITSTITCSETSFWENVEDKDWIAGAFEPDKYYVSAGEPVLRPIMSNIAITGNIVSGLPIPCIVRCNGAEYEVTDGIFEYVTPLNGTYHIIVRAWPYQDWEGDITVENTA